MPKEQIALLLCFVFIDVLGYSLFFPLLPYYAEMFGAGPTLVGLMIAANAAAQIIASPLVGRLSDRFGRRPLMIVSIAGTMVSFLLLGLAEPIGTQLAAMFSPTLAGSHSVSAVAGWTVAMLFFCRILDGLTGGNVSLARAYVSDITDDKNRAKGLGLIGAAFGLGFVIGPVIGGILSNWQAAAALFSRVSLSRFSVPAMAALWFAAINLLGVIIWLPESLPVEQRGITAQKGQPAASLGYFKSLLKHTPFSRLLLVRFSFSLALTLFMANFALYTRYHLGLTDRTTSFAITYAGILLILVQVALIGWVTKRFPEKQILYRGLAIIAVTFFGMVLVQNLFLLLVALLPLALTGGVLNTIINSLISKSVSAEDVGGALGVATSAESLTWVIAPIIGGVLIANLGGWSLGLTSAAICGLLMIYGWQRPIVQSENALQSNEVQDSVPDRPKEA